MNLVIVIYSFSSFFSENDYFYFSLGVEPVDKDVVKQKPRNVKEPMITRSVVINVLMSAFIIIAGTLWVFKREVSLLNTFQPFNEWI